MSDQRLYFAYLYGLYIRKGVIILIILAYLYNFQPLQLQKGLPTCLKRVLRVTSLKADAKQPAYEPTSIFPAMQI